ncbi:agmatine deiminase family protein [Beggiatoa leptomitoformis]|uniref:Putative agmatine deiminase n=1 Tax=Beggiatoa leptomitoformis TaxID=288004 RepID=A0A2N9YIQ8_9GAMM|nr:agmatine deiminase family protein [Beggiatoa leptomitoformis]ALG67379.1 agmatine deiminase [Beggiatoa leptomitoformis]AUI70412.1 agmatine deiminase [Beggiatoa leptomitoformis]
MTTPKKEGFFMPAEWHPHSRCWMAYPYRASVWEDFAIARQAYAQIAQAIARFEPVTMLTPPELLAEARQVCGANVDVEPMLLDDSWTRDMAPTFVIHPDGSVAGVDWEFNAWGGKHLPCDRDALVAETLLAQSNIRRFAAPFILEGGSIHVDGEGTVLTTEECLLNPNRNPQLSKAEIESLLCDYLGVTKVIWLEKGLKDDETDGHIDEIACFVRPGVVLAITTNDPNDENYAILQANLRKLRSETDAQGRPLEVIEIEQPSPQYYKGIRLTLSYINFYIANGGIVMAAFNDAKYDALAFDVISKAFPMHQVVQVPALEIFKGGGGIHCITQQQPKP